MHLELATELLKMMREQREHAEVVHAALLDTYEWLRKLRASHSRLLRCARLADAERKALSLLAAARLAEAEAREMHADAEHDAKQVIDTTFESGHE